MDEFGIIFLHGLDFQSPTSTKRLTSDFSRIFRACRALLTSINRSLNIKDKHTRFEKDQRLLQEGFSLVFLFFLVIFLWGWFSSKLCKANTLVRSPNHVSLRFQFALLQFIYRCSTWLFSVFLNSSHVYTWSSYACGKDLLFMSIWMAESWA
jgi:hypothetical protein